MKRITIALLLSMLCTRLAYAEMLLDTGPGPDNPIGYSVYGQNSGFGGSGYYQSLAGQFTTSETWTIDSILGWMAADPIVPPGPAELHVSIYSNAPSNPAVYVGTGQPGSVVFTAPFQVTHCSAASQSTCPVGWQGATGLSWNLSPGTYWIVFEGTGTDTGAVEMPGPVAASMQNSLFLSKGQDWGELYPGGFGVQITGTTPVPLPAAAWLLLSAFGAFRLFARRRFCAP